MWNWFLYISSWLYSNLAGVLARPEVVNEQARTQAAEQARTQAAETLRAMARHTPRPRLVDFYRATNEARALGVPGHVIDGLLQGFIEDEERLRHEDQQRILQQENALAELRARLPDLLPAEDRFPAADGRASNAGTQGSSTSSLLSPGDMVSPSPASTNAHPATPPIPSTPATAAASPTATSSAHPATPPIPSTPPTAAASPTAASTSSPIATTSAHPATPPIPSSPPTPANTTLLAASTPLLAAATLSPTIGTPGIDRGGIALSRFPRATDGSRPRRACRNSHCPRTTTPCCTRHARGLGRAGVERNSPYGPRGGNSRAGNGKGRTFLWVAH